jgi:hypothetical protein
VKIDEFTGRLRQSFWSALRPPGLNRNFIGGIARLTQALPNSRNQMPASSALVGLRNPITAIAACCARPASGQAAAALPITLMKSRRLMRPSLELQTAPNGAAG